MIEGGLTYIQYADVTVILVACEESIRTMKFLLYCVEWMSGMEINYYKSEVIVFWVDTDTQDWVANALNCQVGSLPMKYLGLPISDRMLGASAFEYLGAKLRKKFQPWKGSIMSYRARLILSNTSLSNLPIYTMGRKKYLGDKPVSLARNARGS